MDPYSSHLPVLRMVLALAKPRRVLELGAGTYSTPTFLDYPSVRELVSLETDPKWADFSHEKLTLRLVADTVAELPDLDDFDLVFVDNADNAADRLRAIEAVLSQPHPPTVIHDADHPPYWRAITDMTEDVMIFMRHTPHTAVCW